MGCVRGSDRSQVRQTLKNKKPFHSDISTLSEGTWSKSISSFHSHNWNSLCGHDSQKSLHVPGIWFEKNIAAIVVYWMVVFFFIHWSEESMLKLSTSALHRSSNKKRNLLGLSLIVKYFYSIKVVTWKVYWNCAGPSKTICMNPCCNE